MEEEMKQIREKKMKELKAKASEPLVINDNVFDELVRKHPLVVIDFWAEWCPPCRIIAPIIHELAKELAEKVTFAKMNVDNNTETAQKFGIMAIPTLLIFKNGKLADQIRGAVPKQTLLEALKKHMD